MSEQLAVILSACMLLALGERAVNALFAVAYGQVASTNEVYFANPKPPTDGLVGANYTPAYAVNQIQFWHDFRPEIVEKELAAARKYFSISTLRVYLHNINFVEEKKVFMTNFEKIRKMHRIPRTIGRLLQNSPKKR